MSLPFPLGGDNAPLLHILERYRADPDSVPMDWRLAFAETDGQSAAASNDLSRQLAAYTYEKVADAFRTHGHLSAKIDPLGLKDTGDPPEIVNTLAEARQVLRDYCDEDLSDFEAHVGRMRTAYAGPIGAEIMHLSSQMERSWLIARYEETVAAPTPPERQRETLQILVKADEFEKFCRIRFPTKKRFGAEGAETLVLFLDSVFTQAAKNGVEEIVMGGMHRGRLNVLVNNLGKPLPELFAEMKGRDFFDKERDLIGDVPYHLGYSTTRAFDGRDLYLTLSPHPSHLLTVAPIALGRARRRQEIAVDAGKDAESTLCLQMHTDAAFAGQGLASELLQLSELKGFRVGGSIHIILNNQIGFTTMPREGRSSRYCTDLAKSIDAPVFHVNADDPEAVAKVARIAVDWRNRFQRDVFIDLVCYRRYGHNELDEPRFTQPGMYAAIDAAAPVREAYVHRLKETDAGVVAFDTACAQRYRDELEHGFGQAGDYSPNEPKWLRGRWTAIKTATAADLSHSIETGLELSTLQALGAALCSIPDDTRINQKVDRFLSERRSAIENGSGINWATAESLALATLLADGTPVRFTGQDSIRGTFTQRHWAIVDQETGDAFLPLQHLSADQAAFQPINSPLAEYGVLSFEYGHSLVDPDHLVIWEAQFGDFANGAQIIIDQAIAPSESRWMRMTGLVALLPHGPEGQGPDHSSSRIERFLQLCADGNMIVANCSTPANYFHILRRQILAPWRKPLFLATPKSLLRNKACVSDLDAMGPGTHFRHTLLFEPKNIAPKKIERLILCTGKIRYDLQVALDGQAASKRIAILSIEQLYPFPRGNVIATLKRFSNAEILWCQEEPENQGPYSYIRLQLLEIAESGDRAVMKNRPLSHIARKATPAPAGGSLDRHEREQAEIVAAALVTESIGGV